MSSKVPALLDYLVTLFTTAGAAAAPPFVVYDGPVVTAAPAQLVLWVGLSDPDSTGPDSAATFTQARGDFGQLTRDETSAITCVAEAWSGTGDLATVRHSAFGVLAAAETAVRANLDQSFGGNGQPYPGVTGAELLQNTTDAGAFARVRFQLQFRSLNT
jgi:hypothetical protein